MALSVAAGGTGASAAETAAGGVAVEEVVVTGSFIKRSEGFPSASPVEVIGVEKLESAAPTNLSNFFADMPSNFGSSISTGRAMGGGEAGFGSVNLRGLGNAATLVLLNGHRQTQVANSPDNIVDVNNLIPDIMIGRFEVLKDGASALYGTDAVAGVVNIITRDNFSGLTAAVRVNQFTYSEKGDRSYQVMGGTDIGGKGHIVAAFSYVDQDLISSEFDSPVLNQDKTNTRYTISAGIPGRYSVPTRNAAGALGASRTIIDPACGTIVGSVPTGAAGATTVAPILPVATATDCRYYFLDDNGLQAGLQRFQGFLRGTYDFTDNVKFTGEFGYTQLHVETDYTAGETVSPTVVIPGTNPGNTFRAVNAAGQQLYALSSGVAAGFSRDGAPVFLPTRDAAGRVVLSPTPTVPGSGIPFYEDVILNGRLLGSQCGLPTGNSMKSGECANLHPSVSDNDIMQASGYFNGTVLDKWDWQAGVAYSKYKIATNGTTFNGLTRQLNLALDGLGGPNCAVTNSATTAPARGTTSCQYFNPFGNSVFATTAGDPKANTQTTIDGIFPNMVDRYESTLMVAEGHISGPLFKVPAGDVGVALGYQFRRSGLKADYDTQRNIGNTLNLNTANDFNVSQNTSAVFGEVNLPLFRNDWGYAEVDAAVRYEKIGDQFNTTDPKVGVLYTSPSNMVTLRGSYGKSFIAPSLFRLFGNVGGGTAVNDCPLALNPVCTGAVNLRATAITSGNPNLKPQTSEAKSFGLTFKPFDELTITLDRWQYSFENLISTESATNVVLADPTGALTGKVVRNATGQLSTIFVQYTNASKVLTSGVDFDVNYRKGLDRWGDVNLDMAGTYTAQYDVTPTVGAVTVKGAGFTNNQGGVVGLGTPLPKWRVNYRATWNLGPHQLMAQARYYSAMVWSQNTQVKIPSYTPVDLTYTYNFKAAENGWLPGGTITIGSTNIFQTVAPYLPFPGFQAFLPTLADIRGRSVWARIQATF